MKSQLDKSSLRRSVNDYVSALTIRLCKKHFKTKYTQGCYAFNQQCLDSSGT